MRLVKRGKRYSIVYEEGGQQRWIATGLSDRAEAEQTLVKERQAQRRRLAGLAPNTEDTNFKLLPAIKGYMKRKKHLTGKQRKALRRRLLAMSYEILRKRRIRRNVRARDIRDVIWPYLRGRRLLDITAQLTERWIYDQFENGTGRLGFKGSSYTTVRYKVRTLNGLMDYWYRRKKKIPENPMARLDMPPANEVPQNATVRKERRPFEVDEAVEFLRASDDLDRRSLEEFLRQKRKPGAIRIPITPVFRTLLGSGARPSEVFTTPMCEAILQSVPHLWIPKERCKTKFKGERMATIHPDLADELKRYRDCYRATAGTDDPFFLGPEGTPLDTCRLRKQFYNAARLAFVRMEARAAGIKLHADDDYQVAYYLKKGKLNFQGGSRLRPETLDWRQAEEARIRGLATLLTVPVKKRLRKIDVYAIRHTHSTWAADREVPDALISKQIGHSIRGTTGRYISRKSLKLLDPTRCSRAVWEMLMAGEADATLGVDDGPQQGAAAS